MEISAFEINPAALVRFDDTNWFVYTPETGKEYKVGNETFDLIRTFSMPLEQRGAAPISQIYSEESLDRAMSALLDARIIITRGDVNPIIREWDAWTPAAWFLHLAGRQVQFATTDEEQDEISRKISLTPPPSRYKCSCTRQTIPLPSPRPIDDATLGDALLRRRTCRLFDHESELSLLELSDLLFYTGGVLFENDTDHFGTVLKKCSPSPGARHSIELYPIIHRVSGVTPGSYHYCVEHHALNLVAAGDKRSFITSVLQVQPYFTNAAVSCFFTSVTSRLRWKYKGPRIYRLAHLEAGHYCQNFLLTGTGLDLGVFSTGAINEASVEEELRLDGVDEIVLYVAGAGKMRGDVPYVRDGEIKLVRVPNGKLPRMPGNFSDYDASAG